MILTVYFKYMLVNLTPEKNPNLLYKFSVEFPIVTHNIVAGDIFFKFVKACFIIIEPIPKFLYISFTATSPISEKLLSQNPLIPAMHAAINSFVFLSNTRV